MRIETRLEGLEDLVKLDMKNCYACEVEANRGDTSAIIIDRMRDDGVEADVANMAIPINTSEIVELAAENIDLFILREPESGLISPPLDVMTANIAEYLLGVAGKELLAIEKEES